MRLVPLLVETGHTAGALTARLASKSWLRSMSSGAEHIDHGVIETGLGGLLDATNVIARHLLERRRQTLADRCRRGGGPLRGPT
jgi:hypothetical protein